MKPLYLLLTIVLTIPAHVIGQSVPSYVPTNGLVGWWGFNGNAQDASGNGNHGTVNGATLTTDRFGNQNGAYSFDGVSNSISIPHSNSIAITGNVSISVWKKSNGNTGNYETFVNKRGGNGEWNYSLSASHYFGGGGCPQEVNKYASGRRNYGGSQYEIKYTDYLVSNDLNIWTNVIVSIDTDTVKFYVNGNLVGNSCFGNIFTIPSIDIQAPLTFGSCNCGLAEWFHGKLDDIGIWNRALSPQEITELYNAQSCQVNVTSQPQNQSTSPSRNVTFSLSSSDSNSTYQWQTDMGFGFQNLTNAGQYSGVTTSSITVSNTSLQNNNQLFRCIVSTTQCGRDTSDVVTLSVNSASSTTNIPKRFNYQSVIRDTSGVLVTNRSIGLKVTLSRGPHLGDLYSETHQLTSNSNGLITSSIGGGTPVLGSMDSIDWSLGDVYIKTEVDVNGGTNYVVLNTNQLLSVPYSLYSLNSGNSVPGPVGPQGPQGVPGNDGLPGPQGNQGVPGNDGAMGPQGPIGMTGPVGPQGVPGNDGAVGPQGPIGLTGPAGSQGPIGPVGLTGPQGPQGVPGNDGAVGPQGPQGPTGLTGPAGPQGPQGIPGNDGAVGPQGPQGIPYNIPVGTIQLFAGSTPPQGWLLCDGGVISRTTYSSLFSVIGTSFGPGDGSFAYNWQDLNGNGIMEPNEMFQEFLTYNLPDFAGKGPMGYRANDSSFNAIGKMGGSKTHTLTETEIPAHNIIENIFMQGIGTYMGQFSLVGNITTRQFGSGAAHPILDPYVTINFIIKY
jgi:microcystin-dependent protein